MARKVLLLAGTKRGLFIGESSVGRTRWKFRGPLIGGDAVYSAMADTRNGLTLVAGVNSMHWGPTVMVSRNAGKTWTRAVQPPRYQPDANRTVDAIWQLQPGGAKERGVLYCGVAPAGLFRSEDNGKTWAEVSGLSAHPTRPEWQAGGGGLCLHTILVHPRNPQQLSVGISAVGVFESSDAGKTWTLGNNGLPSAFHPEKTGEPGSCVHKIAYAAGTDAMYMQNHVGVFKREGADQPWRRIERGLPSRFGFPVVAHPHDPSRAYLIPLKADTLREPKDGRLTVYATADGGRSWKPLDKGLPKNAHVGILRDGFDNDELDTCGLYFGTTSGQIYSSHDEGRSWSEIADLLPPVCSVRVAVVE